MSRARDHRRQVYFGLVGAAVGAILAGLVLPMTIDPRDEVASVGREERLNDSGDAMRADPTTDGARINESVVDSSEAAPLTPAANGPSSAQSSPDVSAGPSGLVASDTGVTKDVITIGALLLDLGGVGRAGFSAPGADAAQQRRYFEAFIADVNDAGGVAGRRVVPVFATFDPLRRETFDAACITLTEDADVFAILAPAGFTGDAILCVTEQHGTPLIVSQGEAEETYRRSRKLLFSLRTASNRMGRTMVLHAHEQGRLRKATIGVVHDDRPPTRLPTEEAIIPQLKSLGYQVAHVSRLTADTSTAQSQIPVEVAEMRRKGVDRILFVTSPIFAGIWFNQAEGQQYRPEYIVTDIDGLSSDFTVQSAPPSLQAVAYTALRGGEARLGRPQQPEATDCQARFRTRTGETVEWGTTGYDSMTAICGQVILFARAAADAGTNPTRARFAGAVIGIRTLMLPNIGGTVSFGPGKFGGADYARTKRHEPSCRCWIPIDEFVRQAA